MRLINFQKPAFVEKLKQNGEIRFSSDGPRTKYIHILMDEDGEEVAYPIYTFIGIPYLGSPGINIPNIYGSWSSLMGYMRLDGHVMIELEVPYTGQHINKMTYNAELTLEEALNNVEDYIECILYEIKKEWVVAVYNKSLLNSGYGTVELTPEIWNKDLKPLIDVPFKVSGDGYAESNIFELLPDYFPDGITYGQLCNYINYKTCSNILMAELERRYGVKDKSEIGTEKYLKLLNSFNKCIVDKGYNK